MGLLRRLLGTNTSTEAKATLFGGSESLAVRGEGSYQPTLWQIVNQIGRDVHAVLLPEPQNQYDPNALAVFVSGLKVGYLSRDDAARYQPGVIRLTREAGNPIALKAQIFGGEPGREHLGIWLRHDPTDFGLPALRQSDPAPREGGGVWTGTAAATLSWMDRLPTDRLAAITFLRKQLDKETGPVERHFMFNELEELLYKCREVFDSALAEYEQACVQHDSEMEGIRLVLVAELGGVPFLPTYKQMAIVKQKAKDYESALWWADRGLQLYGSECVRDDVVADLRQRAEGYRAKVGQAG